MVLEETLYNPTLPTEERGKEAWIRAQNTPPALGKRMRDADQAQPQNVFRRKLRRSASTKLGTQSDALWAGIITPSFEQGKAEEDDWKEDNLFKQTTPFEDPPALHDNNQVARPVALEETNPNTPVVAAADLHPLPGTEQGEGIFQDRIVVTHGFDMGKVVCSIALYSQANVSTRPTSYESTWKRTALVF